MGIPDWADSQLSQDLPILRARGENQEIEYMVQFPQNVRELGKEIAAFATSNPGTILIGVSDDGDIVGLNNASTMAERDHLLRRIEGICRGVIKPALTPTVQFAVEDGKVVLIMLVPKGNQPVYYCNDIPYIRHISQSRPGDPHEVIELVRGWLQIQPNVQGEIDSLSRAITDLAPTLANILAYGEEVEERSYNPWLDMWRAQYVQAASEIRSIAVLPVIEEEGLTADLISLSEDLEEAGTMELYFGTFESLKVLVAKIVARVKLIQANIYDSYSLPDSQLRQLREGITALSRKLHMLANRAEKMINEGRIDDLQQEASALGYELLQYSFYNLDAVFSRQRDQISEIGHTLHKVETMEVYLDGGKSIRAIMEKITLSDAMLRKIISNS